MLAWMNEFSSLLSTVKEAFTPWPPENFSAKICLSSTVCIKEIALYCILRAEHDFFDCDVDLCHTCLNFQFSYTLAARSCASPRLRLRCVSLHAAAVPILFSCGLAEFVIWRYIQGIPCIHIVREDFACMLRTLFFALAKSLLAAPFLQSFCTNQ